MVRLAGAFCGIGSVLGLVAAAAAQTCTPQWSDAFPIAADGVVHASIVYTPPEGTPQLYFGGNFLHMAGTLTRRVASFDGEQWSPMGQGIVSGASVFAFTEFDPDGDGPLPNSLIVAGTFTQAGLMTVGNVARWDGTTWWALGQGVGGTVYALATYDPDGTGPEPAALYAGGLFVNASGTAASHIAKWNGSAWSAVGEGFNDNVYALQVFDDRFVTGNAGPSLYAGGAFVVSGDLETDMLYIARWDGTNWYPLQTGPTELGLSGSAFALETLDIDGSGSGAEALYVGGSFTRAGSTLASRVVRWTGSQWQALGSGLNNTVYALRGHDADGSGSEPPALYAGGSFTKSGTTTAVARIARWDGTVWTALDSGLDSTPLTLATFADRADPNEVPPLYAGGEFTLAGGHASQRVARWGCVPDNEGPRILQAPASGAPCPGTQVQLLVLATGTPPLDYQWFHDDEPIEDATSATYTIASMSAAAVGAYTVLVSNDFGEVTTTPAVLTLGQTPQINVPPESQEACMGASATFTVVASGTGTLTYQWYRDGSVIFGANGTSYTVAPVQLTSVGGYSVRVSGTCGSVLSDEAWLTLASGPEVITSPQSVAACGGDDIQLCVVVDGQGETVTYRWYKDDAPLVGAPNAACLPLTAVNAADAGVYYVEVENSCGVTFSDSATVTIRDNVAIDVPPSSATVCIGMTATFSVTASGTPPLHYVWRKNDELLDTDGPVLELPEVTLDDDQAAIRCTVGNACGTVTTDPVVLTVAPGPTIDTPPADAAVCPGADATFCVTVTYGGDDLRYLWLKDGAELPDAPDANCITIHAVSAADVGAYAVRLMTGCGTLDSPAATLSLIPLPTIVAEPADAAVCGGAPAEFCVTLFDPNAALGYAWLHDEQPVPNGPNAPCLQIAAAEPEDAGTYRVQILHACGVVESQVATLTLNTEPTIIGDLTDQHVCPDALLQLCVAVADDPNALTFTWYRDDAPLPEAPSTPCYTVAAASAATAGAYRVDVANECGTVSSATVQVTLDEQPDIATSPADATVCAGNDATFTVTATGTAPLAYAWTVNGAPAGTDAATLVLSGVTPADDGAAIRCTVTNACGSADSTVATLTVHAAPQIASDLTSLTVCAGDEAQFCVAAADPNGVATYTWTFNGTPLPDGPNSPCLLLAGATSADEGEYAVILTNACGVVPSAAAWLTVWSAPTIDVGPASQTVCAGQEAIFSVSAAGSGVLTYAWTLDGEPVGDSSPTLTLPDVPLAADQAVVGCAVTNDCGSAYAEAVLTVDPCALTVALSLDQVWMYQNLPGQTQSSLRTQVATLEDPWANSDYTYTWEFVLPDDVTMPPVTVSGGGMGDSLWRFAAPDVNAVGGLSDLGAPYTVRVTVVGNQHGNTGAAELPFGICLLADVNNDAQVDVADRAIVNAFWRNGSAGAFTFYECDVNRDGQVDVADRAIANAVWRELLGTNKVAGRCVVRTWADE